MQFHTLQSLLSVQASRIWRSNHVRQPRELSELRNPLNSTCLCTIKRRQTNESKNLLPYIAIAVPPGDTNTDQLISQISQVLLRRETTRDRSYQGPSIVSRLLRRTLPTKALGTQRTDSYQGFIRFASITQNNHLIRRTLLV